MSGTSFELVNSVVRAGAGTGKTTNLTKTVIQTASDFYAAHGRLPNMVVTTFTRKATEELRERITTELFKSDQPELFSLVQSKQHLQISTIHGVLSLFLRQYGQLVGLEAGFTVSDNEVSAKMAKRVLHDVIQDDPNALELMDHYSFEQLLGLLLIRRRKMLEQPQLRAFNPQELKASVQQFIGYKMADLDRVLCLIADESSSDKWVDYAGHFRSCLKQAESDLDITKALENLKAWGRKPPYTKKKPPFTDSLNGEFETLKKEFDSLSNKEGLSPKYFEKYIELASYIDELGKNFDSILKQEKYSTGLIDSEDLELFSLDILRQEPELGSAFASSWDYWLVDEYQDTSPTQVEIMSKLRGSRPVYMVGDPQQSIYLFRGARVEVFKQEEKRILESGGKGGLLSKNYRSRPELLKAINDIVKDLGEGFSPMQPREESYDAKAEVLTLLKSAKSDDEPYQGIVNYIIEKVNAGAKLDDFCVLAKANNTLLKVSQALEASGLSCSVHAASGYFSRREVIDMLSLLKFLVNPHDNLNLVRLLKSPWFRFADENILQFKSKDTHSYWIKMSELFPDDIRVRKLKESLAMSEKLGYLEAFRTLLFDSGIVDLSHWHDSTGRRESNIWKLITELRSQERLSGFNPVQLFRRFERALDKLDDESDAVASKEPNRVNLMTIHKSKGLKFKYVILPNMEKSFRGSSSRGHDILFMDDEKLNRWSPLAPVGDKREYKHSAGALFALEEMSEREKQEALRLLYVAVTRAEAGLCFQATYDEEPSESSWAHLLSCWKSGEGVHEKEQYSFTVKYSPFEKLQLESLQDKKAKTVREPFELKAESGTKQRFSVTSLIEGLAKAQPEQQATQNIERIAKSIKAPSLGSILHGVFERMRYQEHFDLVTYLSDKLGDEAESFIESTDYVLGLNEPPMADLIQTGHVEWGFQVKTSKGILEGQIDLWAEQGGHVWVVDYKSGSTKHSDKAFQQLKYYAWALNKAFGHKSFKLAVVYPLSAEVKVQDFSDLDGIEV